MKNFNIDDLNKLPTAYLLGKIKSGNFSQEENLAMLKILKERKIDTIDLENEVINRKLKQQAAPPKTSKFVIFLFILLALSALNRFYKQMVAEEKLRASTEKVEINK